MHDKGDNDIEDGDEVEILSTAIVAPVSTGGAGAAEAVAEPAELWVVNSARMLQEPFSRVVSDQGAIAFADAARIVKKVACEIHDGDKLGSRKKISCGARGTLIVLQRGRVFSSLRSA